MCWFRLPNVRLKCHVLDLTVCVRSHVPATSHPRGFKYPKIMVSKAMPLVVLGTRILEHWVLGASEHVTYSQ